MEFCFGNIVISLSTITVHILWPITMFDNVKLLISDSLFRTPRLYQLNKYQHIYNQLYNVIYILSHYIMFRLCNSFDEGLSRVIDIIGII